MLNFRLKKLPVILSLFLLGFIINPSVSQAHCDSMDGPVVQAAYKALESGNVNLVLLWVHPEQEAEVRNAFQRTLNVREVNEDVREMADRYFLETLVRLHRESEGAPYTGLKPTGTDFGPAIPAADKALVTGSLKDVHTLLVDTLNDKLKALFDEVRHLQDYNPNDVEAGRKYVEAYVQYMHYVEPIYEAISSEGSHHGTESHGH